ncbi:MAG: transporter [Comamonadaceae bacterium CG_4_9_14_3_um_filter_60_33]|nr:MAG: transporter [Comamonadaceae bacterium CG2_30_59_20]PIY28461.1 MAG: transporter [Comamonadaceae bacterium CG_4_10_14_3_um_filter_60_42]PJB45713.1 MAG: transporter [Comamonadaceae bacterium CG_4_9_14_3_um_filter_60_33]
MTNTTTFASKKLLGLILVSVTLGASLSACFPVIVGGAMVGSLVATDRRTAGTQLEDERIGMRGASLIRTNIGDRVHVNINSYNRRVLLTGEVPSQQDLQLVEQLVSRVENVQAVVNELAVLGSPSMTQRSGDALTTGRVKAGLIDARDLSANAFKVVTERGTVYLMGRVTQRESERATEIARATSGVQKVVRVFEIISEEELRALLPKPAANEAKASPAKQVRLPNGSLV